MAAASLSSLLLLFLPVVGCAVEGSSDVTETAATESTLSASGGSIVKIDCPSTSGAANLVITIDRPQARIPEVIGLIQDLFLELATDAEQLDFPVVYAIGRQGANHAESVHDGDLDVQEHELGTQPFDGRDRLRAVPALTHDLDVGLLRRCNGQPAEAVVHRDVGMNLETEFVHIDIVRLVLIAHQQASTSSP